MANSVALPTIHCSALAVVLMAITGSMAFAADSPGRPVLELRAGERYFRGEDGQGFVLGRNPTGTSVGAMEEHFRNMAAAGERFARIHFTYSPPEEHAGDIVPGMLWSLDGILDAAAKHDIAVMPVLDAWANWNDGSNHELWHGWDRNPSNVSRGGPAVRPDELFADTACRKLWLERTAKFVKHCAARKQIVAWEFFSELDLVTGATEGKAMEFAGLAAATIRAADPMGRPITVSLSGVGEWPALFASDAVRFVEVHPYTGGKVTGDLDELILSSVRARLARYGKPVLIGECGLDFRPPRGDSLDILPRASIGVRHGIWASVVSGAMNGRMLWWHDGYDAYEKAELSASYQKAAVPAAEFVRGVDYAGMVPVNCELGSDLRGAMLGDQRVILGWFRDARCVAPDWPVRSLEGQQVTVAVPGEAWEMMVVDPVSGKSIETRTVTAVEGRLRLTLPAFEDAVAVKLTPRR